MALAVLPTLHPGSLSAGSTATVFRDLLQLRLQRGSRMPVDMTRDVGVTVDLVNGRLLAKGTPTLSKGELRQTGFLPSESAYQAWTLRDTGERKYAE